MDVQDVQHECDNVLRTIRNYRRLYMIIAWILVTLEFIASIVTVTASLITVLLSNSASSYIAAITAVIDLVSKTLHRYINPEERAIEYNNHIRIGNKLRLELATLSSCGNSCNSEQARSIYLSLQDLDAALFGISLPHNDSQKV